MVLWWSRRVFLNNPMAGMGDHAAPGDELEPGRHAGRRRSPPPHPAAGFASAGFASAVAGGAFTTPVV